MGALKPPAQQPTVGLLDAARKTCALDAVAAAGESLKFRQFADEDFRPFRDGD
jgi:hypothetical protein